MVAALMVVVFLVISANPVRGLLSLSLSLLLAEHEWSVIIDPIASLVIAGSILISAVGVFSSSVYDLLDGTLEEKDKLDIMRELVLNFTRYDRLYGVRSRRSGKDVFIDIHLGFDPDQRVGDVERDIEAIRASVARRFKNATVTIVLGPQRKSCEELSAAA
jgi:divalent metal cation (Fe/Co/Zn/Cd) transporter